jgi:hypothetical protein
MRKQEVKKLVLDRAVTRYPKSVIGVLNKIIDLIEVEDWKVDEIDDRYSKATSVSRLEFLTNFEWHTVRRAIKTLLADGVIIKNPHAYDSYRVNVEVLQGMQSRFVANRFRNFERKVLKAVGMKFTRNPERSVKPWSDVHPEQCACVPPFCSHPEAI